MRKKTNSIKYDETKKEKAERIAEEYDYHKDYERNMVNGYFLSLLPLLLHLIISCVFGETDALVISIPLSIIIIPLAMFLILRAYTLRDQFEAAVEFLGQEEDGVDKNTVEDKVKFENTNMTKDEIIGCLENLRDHFVSFEENEIALTFAITEVKKGIQAKPIDNGTWSPKTCPSCEFCLSEDEGDGYYKDSVCLEFCPNCRQVLDWDEKWERDKIWEKLTNVS